MSTTKPAAPSAPSADTPAAPKYNNAGGCLTMLAIALLAIGGSVLLMYFLGNHPVPPPTP